MKNYKDRLRELTDYINDFKDDLEAHITIDDLSALDPLEVRLRGITLNNLVAIDAITRLQIDMIIPEKEVDILKD